MKTENKKVIRIAEELLELVYSVGASDVDLKIRETEEAFWVTIKSQFHPRYKSFLEEIETQLATPRNCQMETYYWELIGDDDSHGFGLIGMMTDAYEMIYEDHQLEITLIRKK